MNKTMTEKIFDWYAYGETGVSSKAMAQAVQGKKPEKDWGTNHPSDPADFNRCLKFLNAVPEAKEHMDKVAKLSKVWGRLVERWHEVEKSFLDEVGYDWHKAKSAPNTFKLMKEIIGDKH